MQLKCLRKNQKKALNRKIIEYSDDFIEIAPQVNSEIKKRKQSIDADNLPFDDGRVGKMKISNVKASKGKNVSPLKGLVGKERDDEMDKHLNENIKSEINDILDNNYL